MTARENRSFRYILGVSVLVALIEGVFYFISDAVKAEYSFWGGFAIMAFLNVLIFILAQLGVSHPHAPS